MTEFEEKIRKDLAAIPFSDKEHRNILKVVLGEIQRKPVGGKVTEEMAHNVVKGMIKSNEEMIHYFAADNPRCLECERENAILRAILPAYLSEDAIRSALQSVDIQSAKGDGQAVGMAMKYFKESGLSIEGETVKKVVLAMRK
jgi:uncharacterized protein YqeY